MPGTATDSPADTLTDRLPLGPQDPVTEAMAEAIWRIRRAEVRTFSGLDLPAWPEALAAHKDCTRLMAIEARASAAAHDATGAAGRDLLAAVEALRGREDDPETDFGWLDRATARAREVFEREVGREVGQHAPGASPAGPTAA